jgi:acyl carrier protein
LVESALLKDDLKLDSLDFVDMMVVLEEKFEGTIPEFDFTAVKTLGDIYNLVAQIANQKKP